MSRPLLGLALGIAALTASASGSVLPVPWPVPDSVYPAGPVPVVVELFTSEGCSSCPPADQVLMDLNDRQPVPGAFVIGLSEHVDYWNSLGWKDPFSDALFSRRQSSYADVRNTTNIYTPQMIVDGADEFVGSDRSAALAAIAHAAARPKPAIVVEWTPDAPTVRVMLAAGHDTSRADVFVALLEDGLRSSVSRGENAGHELVHSGVTRRLINAGKTALDGSFQATVSLGVDLEKSTGRALKVVAFVARPSDRHIVAAALAALPATTR